MVLLCYNIYCITGFYDNLSKICLVTSLYHRRRVLEVQEYFVDNIRHFFTKKKSGTNTREKYTIRDENAKRLTFLSLYYN